MTIQKIIDDLKKSGFSYYRIEKETGISQSTLRRWHLGLNAPNKILQEILIDKIESIINEKEQTKNKH